MSFPLVDSHTPATVFAHVLPNEAAFLPSPETKISRCPGECRFSDSGGSAKQHDTEGPVGVGVTVQVVLREAATGQNS
jgi:hypothetical protein